MSNIIGCPNSEGALHYALENFMKIELTEKDKYMAEYSTDAQFDSKYGKVICEVTHETDEFDSLPTDAVERVQGLVDKVISQADAMCDKIYASYVMYCNEPEWMEMMGIPLGLSFEEIKPHVGQLTMSVGLGVDSENDRFSISLRGGGWDCEHGVYVTLKEDSWEFTDY